jgi:hypothetical protein
MVTLHEQFFLTGGDFTGFAQPLVGLLCVYLSASEQIKINAERPSCSAPLSEDLTVRTTRKMHLVFSRQSSTGMHRVIGAQ